MRMVGPTQRIGGWIDDALVVDGYGLGPGRGYVVDQGLEVDIVDDEDGDLRRDRVAGASGELDGNSRPWPVDQETGLDFRVDQELTQLMVRAALFVELLLNLVEALSSRLQFFLKLGSLGLNVLENRRSVQRACWAAC